MVMVVGRVRGGRWWRGGGWRWWCWARAPAAAATAAAEFHPASVSLPLALRRLLSP